MLGAFGYVGGSFIFASRIIRRFVTPPRIYFSPSSSPLLHLFPLIPLSCPRRLRPEEALCALQIRLNFWIRKRVSETVSLATTNCVLCINVRSLVLHVILVRNVIAVHFLDVGETWLRNSIDFGSVDIDNFVLIRLDPQAAARAVSRYISMNLSNFPRSAWAFRQWVH